MGFKILFLFAVPLFVTAQVTSDLRDFMEIVRQRANGNDIPQCPCVIHPESGQCIVYNARYQASSIEEAMYTFSDLTLHTEPERDVVSYSCTTVECQQCFSLLYYHLIDNGIVDRGFRPVTPLLDRSALRPSLCTRYGFLRNANVPPPPDFVPPHVRTLIINGLRSSGRRLPQVKCPAP
ncbi:unnamed protein product [Strongylus vulgaris]|uniref:Uncharacterized protein n=1 Tax=Strongylus vulgaris TaxID=40348 RepID=A0A3P7IVU1_STRVU|nr:unnamed protein product [Strongylus vulgaris]